VAEGVVVEDDWNVLTELGVDPAQVWHITQAMPGDALSTWWRARRIIIRWRHLADMQCTKSEFFFDSLAACKLASIHLGNVVLCGSVRLYHSGEFTCFVWLGNKRNTALPVQRTKVVKTLRVF